MKHEDTSIHPSNYTTERIVSDAEFVQGGAQIEDGHLHVTAEQVIATAQQHENDHKLGEIASREALALYSRSAEVAGKELDEIVTENDRLLGLTNTIAEAARPYTTLLNELVPEPGPQDRNWMGRLKDKVDLEPRAIERRLDGMGIVQYNLAGSYAPGEKANQLSAFEMEIKRGEKSRPNNVTLGYANGVLTSIDLKMQDYKFLQDYEFSTPDKDAIADRRMLINFIHDNRMAESPESLLDVTSHTPIKGSLHIEIGANAITIDTTSKVVKNGQHYDFIPEENAFLVSTTGRQLSSDEFMRVVRGIFGLIPTMPAEQ